MATLTLGSGEKLDDVERRLERRPDAFRGGAANFRQIHLGLASACDPLLEKTPVDADLRTFDPELMLVRRLLHAAVTLKQVLLPVATKVLFRKRRGLIPMLGNVVLAYYFEALGRPELLGRSQDKALAADVGVTVLRAFRDDLVGAYEELRLLADRAEQQARPVGPLRMLEVLLWCQEEPRADYRT